ncbi:MAG: CHRD domain-containing protein [Planctomycetota bacterium]
MYRCFLVLSCLVLCNGWHANAAEFQKSCLLSGLQEVPATPSSAFGCGRFIVDTTANTVTYRISYAGLLGAETVAHIHGPAPVGTNGGVAHALPAGSPKMGVWNYPEAQEADILAGSFYVNIHSAAFPGGEIRGQIVDANCRIDAAQEVPPSGATGALGWGVFNIDVCTNTVTYHIATTGLSSAETAAHIHGLAPHGSNAGVLHALPAGPVKTGTWSYAESLEAFILDGCSYVNIHTVNNPAGEIRGQIATLICPLDGGQEVPPNPSAGAGCAILTVEPIIDRLSYDILTLGLGGVETAAHIHGFAPVGANAGVQLPLPAGPRKLGLWTYGPVNAADVLGGLTYVNIHTSAVASGEIRGQLLFRPVDADCNTNGIPDYCEPDCNGNGMPDDCDVAMGIALDCNNNMVPDACDIAMGTSLDVDMNGVPDECAPAAPMFKRGDCNTDDVKNIADAIFALNFLFPTMPPPTPLPCEEACDANDDDSINIADAVQMLNILFPTGPPPAWPAPDACGVDPTPGALGCGAYNDPTGAPWCP